MGRKCDVQRIACASFSPLGTIKRWLVHSVETAPPRQKEIHHDIGWQNLHRAHFYYEFGCPLFVSGACINYLGGDVQNSDIFMLDGSRRLYAHILNESNPNVLFIDLKVDYNE